MERNADQIRLLLLDAVQEFDSCRSFSNSIEFDREAYSQDAAFRDCYDNVFITFNISAVHLAFLVRSYKDFLIFPDKSYSIFTIEGNFDVFYDLFSASLDRLRACDQQIRFSRFDQLQPQEDLFCRYGHAVKNLQSCCYFLSCYVSAMIEDLHFKIVTCC